MAREASATSAGSVGSAQPASAGLAGSAGVVGVWGRGVYGAEAVGATLDGLAGAGLLVLHERLMRDEQGRLTRAHIDHLAVAAGGVWVVAARASKGSLRVRRSPALLGPRLGPRFGPRLGPRFGDDGPGHGADHGADRGGDRGGDRGRRLVIGGRDRTGLLVAVARQVAAVRRELAAAGRGVPVRGGLCFVGTGLPWFRRSVDGIRLLGRHDLAALLTRPGPLTVPERQLLAEFLNERFPRR
jgi:hypothetical protein